jgi:hypothetical protein
MNPIRPWAQPALPGLAQTEVPKPRRSPVLAITLALTAIGRRHTGAGRSTSLASAYPQAIGATDTELARLRLLDPTRSAAETHWSGPLALISMQRPM